MEIERANRIPFGYGLAYWNHNRMTGVFYPIPFNLITGWWHWFYWNFLVAGSRKQTVIDESYSLGFKRSGKIKEDWLRLKCEQEFQRGYDACTNDLRNIKKGIEDAGMR